MAGSRSWGNRGRCGSGGGRVPKPSPSEAHWPEKQGKPEDERQAEFKENAQKQRHRREDGADSVHKGISEPERSTCQIRVQGGAIVFPEREADVCLGNGGEQTFVLAFSFEHSLICLGNVLL